MIEQIRFLRVHMTADDARALAVQDLIGFQREFPGCIQGTPDVKIMNEFFAHLACYGCALRVTVDADDATWTRITAWLERFKESVQANSEVLRKNPMKGPL